MSSRIFTDVENRRPIPDRWSARTRPRFGTGRHVCQWESSDLSPHSTSPRAIRTRLVVPFASWTAPAKRSDDGAFARTRDPRTFERRRPPESGVALRFPPQSMTPRAMTRRRRRFPLPGLVWGQARDGGGVAKKILGFTRVDDVGFCWGFRRFWRTKSRGFWA